MLVPVVLGGAVSTVLGEGLVSSRAVWLSKPSVESGADFVSSLDGSADTSDTSQASHRRDVIVAPSVSVGSRFGTLYDAEWLVFCSCPLLG